MNSSPNHSPISLAVILHPSNFVFTPHGLSGCALHHLQREQFVQTVQSAAPVHATYCFFPQLPSSSRPTAHHFAAFVITIPLHFPPRGVKIWGCTPISHQSAPAESSKALIPLTTFTK